MISQLRGVAKVGKDPLSEETPTLSRVYDLPMVQVNELSSWNALGLSVGVR